MSRLKLSSLSIALMILNGCATATDKTLSPPSDTQWVNVEIKNPSPYTSPFPLEVVYLSDVCKKNYISGFDGKRVEEVNYNPISIPLKQKSNSDIYQAKIAMTGGGACQWRLSEFNLGIEYIDAKHLGKGLVPGTAVGATIAFDDVASRNGQFESVSGNNLKLAPKYFPMITRWSKRKDSNKPDDVSLFGEGKAFISQRIYPKNDLNIMINYYPILDEKKTVEITFPYAKNNGDHTKIKYPDGSVVSDGSIYPDFEKVEKIN